MSHEFESEKPNKLKRLIIPGFILTSIVAGGVILSNYKEEASTKDNNQPSGEIGTAISTSIIENASTSSINVVNIDESTEGTINQPVENIISANEDRETQIESGISMAEYSKYIQDNYPLAAEAQRLNSRLYTAGICESKKYPGDDLKIAICIYVQDPEISSSYSNNTLDAQGIRDALKDRYSPYVNKQITSLGYNPSDYEIIYIDNNADRY
jgi:hypothetical protein